MEGDVMKKKSTKSLSLILAFAMVIPMLCMGTLPAVAEDSTLGQVTPIDESLIIENADSLTNGAQAYYKDATKTHFVGENQQMRFEYALREKGNMQVTSLKDKDENSYFENSFDAFVTLNNGARNYASDSTDNVFANVHRLGYYYYDMRLEGQNFISDYNVVSSEIKNFAILTASDLSYSQKNGSTTTYGKVTGEITNSEDPYLVFNPNIVTSWGSGSSDRISYDGDKYQYISITMATDPGITSVDFYYSTNSDSGFTESRKVSFQVYGTGSDAEAVTYMVPMFTSANYKGTIDELRLDFGGAVGAKFNITKLEMVEVNDANYPQGLHVVRDFLIYSDKMHAFTQFTATQQIDNIAEMGVELKLAKSTVGNFVIKADGTTYENSLAVSNWETAEYAGFVINGVGVLGYIMPADNSGGTLTVTEEGDYYVIRQTFTPENGTIIPSTEGMTDEEGNPDPNGNDIFIGQRIYTDDETNLDKFLVEAENERNPIPESSISVSEDSDGSYWGYDAIRGIYKFNIGGFGGFNEPYYSAQNRHFKLNFTIEGEEDKNRDIWVMTYCPKGMLECAALLDANGMMIPVPLQVGKNFSETFGERNMFNLDDPLYSETIFPMDIQAGSKNEYTLLNLYQNWGQYPLKQLSWIQYSTPYYHLSTGVSESNCIVPAAVSGPSLPDHRAMSAPLWVDQPQHNSCGSHKWLTYKNAAGTTVDSMSTTDYITSYGPNYAELDMNFVTSDGKIMATYTHMEMPQTDENRTYYTLKYEVLEDVTINDFKNNFQFYSVGSNDPAGVYTRVGYLDQSNKSTVVKAKSTGSTASYVLGNECPYFSYFDMDGAVSTHNQTGTGKAGGYSNLAFLVYNSDFTIGGVKANPSFIINDLGGRIAISLNLNNVTLKAGDTFTINAILLPWGSQEMEGQYDTIQDQNVREVRANTLLDPVKIVPDAEANNAEVVESAFLPRVKTTNGNNATFTISGGENNQTIRVDGFKKLTDPKIFELVGGEWKKIEVCSALTPDINGDGHSYDGYGVYYDSKTDTYSYTFVTNLEGDQTRTFYVDAADDFNGWEETVADNVKDKSMNVLLAGEDLINIDAKSKGNIGSEVLNPEAEEFDYVRYTNISGKEESYAYIFADDKPEISGNYIVMKYRVPTGQTLKTGWIDLYCCTDKTSAGSANYRVGWSCLSNDGEWHLLIVDISARNDADFVREEDGSSKAKHLRVDMFNWNTAPTETCYMDIAYVGMSDSLSEIFAYDTKFTDATLCTTGSDVGVKIDAPTDEAEITVSSHTKKSGDLFILPVEIKNNPGISYLDIMPVYDKNKFTFMGVLNGDVLEGLSVKGSHIIWSNTYDSSEDGTLINLAFKANFDLEEASEHDFSVKVIDANSISGQGVNTAVTGGPVTVWSFNFGKVNDDGSTEVNIGDIVTLRKYIADYDYETGTSSVTVAAGADANYDGSINTHDLILLRQYLANYNYDTGESTVVLGPQITDSTD